MPWSRSARWYRAARDPGTAARALVHALVGAIAILARLVVGHLADYFGVDDITIGPAAIGLAIVVVVLTTVADAVY